MPAVKCLHQESENNTKGEFIMGHSFQTLALLAIAGTGQVAAIPLVSRICEGLRTSTAGTGRSSSGSRRCSSLSLESPDDRHSGCGCLLRDAHHHRAVAGAVTISSPGPLERRRVRASPYSEGAKARQTEEVRREASPVGFLQGLAQCRRGTEPRLCEEEIKIQYRSVDLLWRPVGALFVSFSSSIQRAARSSCSARTPPRAASRHQVVRLRFK